MDDVQTALIGPVKRTHQSADGEKAIGTGRPRRERKMASLCALHPSRELHTEQRTGQREARLNHLPDAEAPTCLASGTAGKPRQHWVSVEECWQRGCGVWGHVLNVSGGRRAGIRVDADGGVGGCRTTPFALAAPLWA